MDDSPLFISAGEQSGDNAGALLISALKKKKVGLSFFGLGGNRMKAAGQVQLADISSLAVMGFWEVAQRYFYFRALFNRCLEEIKIKKPCCVILIDYPGFNLRLAKEIKKLGITVIYYISPQIWAWGQNRVEEIRQNIDKMMVILPFEKVFYAKHGINCEFVGHYLLEDIPSSYISSPVPSNGQIGIFPGSRKDEIDRLLLPMLATASQFNKQFGAKAVIAGVDGVFNYDKLLRKVADDNISIVYDDPRKVIFESCLVLTKSGTATLETAIIGRPMVVCYRTGLITYQIARRLIKIDKIAMVNLVLGKKVAPELIQSDANSDSMFRELELLYRDKQKFHTMKKELDKIPQLLGGTGASEKAANLVLSFLN
jgi:lipid-A-disaccharide synthase